MAKDIKEIEALFEQVKKDLNTPEKTNEEEATISPIQELETAVNELYAEIANLEEGKLMAVADSQNTVRRFQNEAINIRKYGGEKLASNILPVIETFKTVLKTSPDIPEVKNYLIGFEMIVNQIDNALAESGVTMIQTKIGDDFSPELHTAIEQVETEAVESGKISAVISNGYKLHDRVIKHASVKVAK